MERMQVMKYIKEYEKAIKLQQYQAISILCKEHNLPDTIKDDFIKEVITSTFIVASIFGYELPHIELDKKVEVVNFYKQQERFQTYLHYKSSLQELQDSTGLTKQQIDEVLECYEKLIK